ncbi:MULTISPECIES: CBS domain-containing protein [Rheinheimera]|uniref:CBS domain-containing protein n=1 Tax=Rheinheimera marina TaxID=1774958 RepID=A0ABV9JLY7_9GAMM
MSLVKDIYQTELVRLQQDDTIVHAVEQLQKAGVSGAAVFHQQQLVGFLSEQDCLGSMLHASYFCSTENKIQDVMTKKVISVKLTDSLIDAAMIFNNLALHQLPVLDHDNQVVGMLYRHQVVKALVGQLQQCYKAAS